MVKLRPRQQLAVCLAAVLCSSGVSPSFMDLEPFVDLAIVPSPLPASMGAAR